MKVHFNNWHHHPGVRSGDQLTLGERAADLLRNGYTGSAPDLGNTYN